MQYPHTIEPKINGIRGLCVLDSAYPQVLSSLLNPLKNHEELLRRMMQTKLPVVVDGEFYAGSWEDTITAMKSSSPQGKKGHFWAFDILPVEDWKRGKCEIPHSERREWLKKDFRGIPGITICPSFPARTEDEIVKRFDDFRRRGFEGGVIKDPHSPYISKNRRFWLKVKSCHTEDYKIVGVKEGNRKYTGALGSICVQVNGTTVDVGTGFTDYQRHHFWQFRKKLIGKVAEVSYQEKTRRGSLWFPRFERLRTDL